MINGVNNVTQLNNVQNISKTDNSAKVKAESDSISVSKEAVEMAEAYYMDKVAADTPDVRADRIAEVKAKIKDPSYLSNAIIQSTAEKLMTSYGL